MNKILAAVVGIAVAATTLLTGTASADAAAPACPQPDYSYVNDLPSALVVSSTGSATLSIEVGVVDPCHATTTMSALITSPEHSGTFALAKVATKKGDVDVWTVDLKLSAHGLANGEAGTWKAKVTGKSGTTANAKLDLSGTFPVLRKGVLSTKVSAKKVKKNAKVTVSATLTRANWEKGTDGPYGKQKVSLQLKVGKGSYTTVKTLSTTGKGAVKASLKVTKAGCYRARFGGTGSTSAVTSKAVCVTLK